MNIKINGKSETVNDQASIADIVAARALAADRIVVEHNYRITAKDEWPGIALRDNDNIEIVTFMGGGSR